MVPLSSIGHLRHEVREIILGLHMGRQYLTHCNSLVDSVVANGQVLLFQCLFWPLSVMDNRHVVTIDVGWSCNGDAHHAELVSNAPQRLHV